MEIVIYIVQYIYVYKVHEKEFHCVMNTVNVCIGKHYNKK